jgi:hypothetical protein
LWRLPSETLGFCLFFFDRDSIYYTIFPMCVCVCVCLRRFLFSVLSGVVSQRFSICFFIISRARFFEIYRRKPGAKYSPDM